jgi:ABC-type dipeptide/oligopeptide/nickel transport system permease component
MLTGLVAVYATLLVLLNLLVDLAYTFLDPRVRYD